MTGSPLDLPDERRDALARLVGAWLAQRATEGRTAGGSGERGDRTGAAVPVPVPVADQEVTIVEVEVLRPGRPGLLDVIAEIDGRLAHAVLGLRRPGDEVHLLRSADQPVLGLLEDDHGLALVVDALRDAGLAPLVLAAVTGEPAHPGPVVPLVDDQEVVSLAFADHCSLSVFPWLDPEPHRGVALLVALDEAGFNHLAAPLALWRRGGRDLGVVQEWLVGGSGAWALALTSLRDLYARGGAPEEAGGDFGPEARTLGTMTARMHLALDRAFGRRAVPVAGWVDDVHAAVPVVPDTVADMLDGLRSADLRASAIQTHGDFHLGRIARTDHGWVVADTTPGGVPPGSRQPVMRSPLADVADLLWSLHRAAAVAAADRDPADRETVTALAEAWESRNRRAFMAGYLATPGIGGLLPTNRDHLLALVAAFELAREARAAAMRA